MAQPNFQTILNELALIPNLPWFNPQLVQDVQQILQQNRQILQQNNQIAQRMQDLEDRMQNLDNRMQNLDNQMQNLNNQMQNLYFFLSNCNAKFGISQVFSENLLPIKLYNAIISLENPIRYPPGLAIIPPLPVDKAALQQLTGEFSWTLILIPT